MQQLINRSQTRKSFYQLLIKHPLKKKKLLRSDIQLKMMMVVMVLQQWVKWTVAGCL